MRSGRGRAQHIVLKGPVMPGLLRSSARKRDRKQQQRDQVHSTPCLIRARARARTRAHRPEPW